LASSFLETEFDKLLTIARTARSKGLDPASVPESEVAVDVAERVEKSVGPAGIASRIRELSVKLPREEVALKVAEEIALARFPIEGQAGAEQAIRTAAAILDEGVTAAPLQGINAVKVKENSDKTKYLALYFAGPIRSAGGTEMGLITVVAEYVRQVVGLSRYKATDLDAKRFLEELRLYEREVARFQFKIPDDEVINAVMRLPVEITGVETDPVEVASCRNVPRIETNGVRGGALRVVNDGLIGRSKKVVKMVEKLSLSGWDWLRDLRKPAQEADEEVKEMVFMEDIIAGRPIFCLPGVPGGFRLRYGRTRITGMAAIGIHPATMIVLDDFLATGTQLRTELPGKAGIITPVETIAPPIVKLKDGSVIRLESAEQAKQVKPSIESILFIGDLLVSFGDFLENNRPLARQGLTEEWWAQLLNMQAEHAAELSGLPENRLQELITKPLEKWPTAEESLVLSEKTGVPLHPRYAWLWERITGEEWQSLRKALVPHLSEAKHETVRMPVEPKTKALLETLCIPHTTEGGVVSFARGDAAVLAACLGVTKKDATSAVVPADGSAAVKNITGFSVISWGGTFVGARMGRPEKARRREMRPIVHSLFPVGLTGGPRRNIVDAAKKRSIVETDLARRRCKNCGEITHQVKCPRCEKRTEAEWVCPRCGKPLTAGSICGACKINGRTYDKGTIAIADVWDAACKKLQLAKRPELVKGIRGLTSGSKCPEPLEKGILRATHDLSMFKDGTVRFDATNAPLTHFRPIEAGATVEKLQKLGYRADINGAPLEQPDQLLAVEFQDIIVNESCGEYLLRVSKFIDDLLVKFYELPPFYSATTKEDLLGHLVVGLSPHTSVGVIGRIVGFTKAKVCFAHPFWHAAKRRDCDGDEDSVTLVLDVLLNFSKAFLPSRIGGIMDAALLLTLILKPTEVARQALNIEVTDKLPLRFFEETCRNADPKTLTDLVPMASHVLKDEQLLQPIGFTHEIGNINTGTHESTYSQLPTMLEKLSAQLGLAKKIRAVSAADVASRVLSTHLMRDLLGNLRAFSTQRMRCTKCNAKFRRPPLRGVCSKCGGKLVLTVHRGSIEKYLGAAHDLVKQYGLGQYNEERLFLIEEELASLFSADKEEEAKSKAQQSLASFM
jgi:DNA polymerase II large subunit